MSLDVTIKSQFLSVKPVVRHRAIAYAQGTVVPIGTIGYVIFITIMRDVASRTLAAEALLGHRF